MENEGDRIVHVTQQEIFDVVMETFGGDALGDLMSKKLRETVAFGIVASLVLRSDIRINKGEGRIKEELLLSPPEDYERAKALLNRIFEKADAYVNGDFSKSVGSIEAEFYRIRSEFLATLCEGK